MHLSTSFQNAKYPALLRDPEVTVLLFRQMCRAECRIFEEYESVGDNVSDLDRAMAKIVMAFASGKLGYYLIEVGTIRHLNEHRQLPRQPDLGL